MSTVRVATCQEMVRGKICQCQGNLREFHLESGKIDILKKNQRLLINRADLIPLKGGRKYSGSL